jgi:hypothetical protein
MLLVAQLRRHCRLLTGSILPLPCVVSMCAASVPLVDVLIAIMM